MVNQYVNDISDLAINELESKIPTTVIFNNLISEKSTGYNSLAIRISNNEFCKNLITEFGKPISSTSANTHGREIPLSYESIEDEIINNVNHIVKYKFPKKVKPSRIIEIKGDSIKIVRS
jgi:L-threonylcarbamoyladenylate synthase